MHARVQLLGLIATLVTGLATPAAAVSFFFSTGNPDGLMAMAARGPNSQIEAADDFVTTAPTTITSATFTGLITGGVPLSNIGEVNIDLYHVFPIDSDTNRTPNVLTRVNSPADTEFDGRNSTAGTLTFTPGVLNPSFTAANSVLNGINPFPNQTTSGEGAVTGQEVQFNVIFTTPFSLPAGHFFFVPTVAVTGGEFFWLSASRPIVPPGTPFLPDLQAWMRNTALDPDWSRVGTDIVGGNPAPTFDATFSLVGQEVPEPSTLLLLGSGLVGLAVARGRRHFP
jgi:PEP-CTERM motif